MVTKELIAELEKARDLFEWTLLNGDLPPIERRKNPRLRVRGRGDAPHPDLSRGRAGGAADEPLHHRIVDLLDAGL